MRISKVTYAQLKNTGHYENERAECTVEVGEGEDPKAALLVARRFVQASLGLNPSRKDIEAARTLLDDWAEDGDLVDWFGSTGRGE